MAAVWQAMVRGMHDAHHWQFGQGWNQYATLHTRQSCKLMFARGLILNARIHGF